MNRIKSIIFILIILFFCKINLAQVISVDIDFSNFSGNKLEKKFGGYTPEKIMYADKIYDSKKTLGAQKPKFSRFQLPLDNVTAANPVYVDPTYTNKFGKTVPSQKAIIDILLADSITPFITLNVPSTLKGNLTKIESFFENVVTTLNTYTGGRTFYLELFGEPDLSIWGYANFNAFWPEFKAAYKGANKSKKANIMIGGAGFALSGMTGDKFCPTFIDSLIRAGIHLDFISNHPYYQWNDANWLQNADKSTSLTRYNNMFNLIKKYETNEGHHVEQVVSEICWANGDWNVAFVNCRSILNYRSCARTFETFAIGIDEMPNVEKFCWAQSVGQNLWSFLSGDFFTFFPFVNYNLKGSTEWYAYKSNYYSFWFYDLMPENRNKFTPGTNEIKGFASSDTIKKMHFIALWNRTSLTKKIKLNFLGLDTIANFYCKYYIIDDKSYNELNQSPIGIPSKLTELDTISLMPEATLLMEIQDSIIFGEKPFAKNAYPIPGTIEAENFDLGGESYAYHVVDSVNKNNVYRLNEKVNIDTSSAGGYCLSHLATGEWFNYSVTVASDNYYLVEMYVAASKAGGNMHIEFNGSNKTRSKNIPVTDSLQIWTVIADTIQLNKGGNTMKIYIKSSEFNLDKIVFTKLPYIQTPYNGSPNIIPGTIQAENYDMGGEGVSYHDFDKYNSPGWYRSDDVDINAGTGFYYVTSIYSGEWLEYTVKVLDSGRYVMNINAATSAPGKHIRLILDGNLLKDSVALPYGGSLNIYSTNATTIVLPAGIHIMRVYFESSSINLDKFAFFYDPTSINVVSQTESNILVYPNPLSERFFYIDFKENKNSNMLLSIYDIQKKLILRENIITSNKTTVKLPEFIKTGVYLITLSDGKTFKTEKIVISK